MLLVQSTSVRTALALLLVLLLGIVDLATGIEIGFSIFYLLPIYLISWHGGLWPGLLVAMASAAAWLTADLLGGHLYASPLIPFWNTLVRLFIFLLTAYLLARIKTIEFRRRGLERIFFHDVLNLAGAIRGYSELLQENTIDREQAAAAILAGTERIIEEIETQKTVSAAINRDLEVEPVSLQSRAFLEQIVALYRQHEVARERELTVDPKAEEVLFESDPPLLGRILGNMIKNALEATPPGGKVSAGCRRKDGQVEFWVHNPGHIPPAEQQKVFKPSFSTKSATRGLGTYSMQLLSVYLRGRVSFSSSSGQGTVFRARYPRKWRHS